MKRIIVATNLFISQFHLDYCIPQQWIRIYKDNKFTFQSIPLKKYLELNLPTSEICDYWLFDNAETLVYDEKGYISFLTLLVEHLLGLESICYFSWLFTILTDFKSELLGSSSLTYTPIILLIQNCNLFPKYLSDDDVEMNYFA